MNNSRRWLALGIIIVSGWLLYLLSPILTPFIISILLAYLGDPVVDRLEKITASRSIAVSIVFMIMLLFGIVGLLFVLPLLERQIADLITRLPVFINWIQNTVPPFLTAKFGVNLAIIDFNVIKEVFTNHIGDIGSFVGRLLIKLTQSGQWFFIWVSYLILIPVITFYLLRDWDLFVKKIHDMIPRPYEKLIGELVRRSDAMLAQFMRGQLSVMLCLAAIYSIGLWIAGLDFFLLLGIVAGAVSFVPYLGFFVGVTISIIISVLQFHDFIHIFYILIVFGAGQLIESFILSPILIGDRIGLHPVAVIFAVLAGGQLFGFVGVLLALPVATVIAVALRYITPRYLKSDFYTP